jgi:hypothetical protein
MRRAVLTRRRVLVGAALAAGLVAALAGSRRAALPRAAEAAPRVELALAEVRPGGGPAPATGPARLAVPVHGTNEHEFVRQRHDYPPDTPEKLGPRIGRVLFDLETVIDMVAHGHEEGSAIAVTRGRALTADEQKAGQTVLQQFFDEATPVVDAALAQELPLDQAFERLLQLRIDLNCRLMGALALDEPQLLALWPQMEGMTDEGCSGRTDKPDREIIPEGMQRRGDGAERSGRAD